MTGPYFICVGCKKQVPVKVTYGIATEEPQQSFLKCNECEQKNET